MSLSDRYLDWKNLCVNKILFNVVYSQKYVAYSKICHFFASASCDELLPEASFGFFDGFLGLVGGHRKGIGLVVIFQVSLKIFLGLTAPYNGLLHFRTPSGALSFPRSFANGLLGCESNSRGEHSIHSMDICWRVVIPLGESWIQGFLKGRPISLLVRECNLSHVVCK